MVHVLAPLTALLGPAVDRWSVALYPARKLCLRLLVHLAEYLLDAFVRHSKRHFIIPRKEVGADHPTKSQRTRPEANQSSRWHHHKERKFPEPDLIRLNRQ